MKQKWLISIFILSILMLASGCASTGGGKSSGQGPQLAVITGIDLADNKLNIVVNKPFTYTIYKSSDPYKVIVELPDVRLGIPANKIKSDKAGITEIIPIQIEEPLSTKLEILLSSPVNVEPVYKDNILAISVKEEAPAKIAEVTAEAPKAEEPVKEVKWAEAGKPEQKPLIPTAAVKEEPTTIKPEPKAAVPAKEFSPATAIIEVNIEKGTDVLKVVIKGNGSLNPKVFRLDNRAVLDMPNVTLNATLPASVPLPLTSIRAGKHRDKTRLVLDLEEGARFDVAAIEDSVIISFRLPEKEKYVAKASEGETKVVEIKNAVAPAEKPAEGKYKGQKISLDFQDAAIIPIFRLLADISGFNFVIDPAVSGKITLKLINVPWDQTLDIILQTFNLSKSVDGNVLWIAPTATFTKMAEDKKKAKDVEQSTEDLVEEEVKLNYATVADINAAITQGKLLSIRGSVTSDTRRNALIIKDTRSSIDKVKNLVGIMDQSKDQVMIEAKIVQVSSDYNQALGIRWGGDFQTANIHRTDGAFSINTPVVSAGSSVINPGGVLSLGVVGSSVQVNLSLSALESIGKSKTLSNPKILTLDKEAATIQQGRTFFISTVSQAGTQTTQQTATLMLSVTPKITPDEYIELTLNVTDNSLVSVEPPVVDTKSLQTKALVKNGETLVLGGIYTTGTTEGETGIPLLSRIPILGWLFKTKTQTGPNVKEMLVFITPTIVPKPVTK